MKFTKMQGLGNDFVVIDAISQTVNMTTELARTLADRRFGIGCDQILLVEKPVNTQADFRYRIFNADGSEVAQCGNGARCFARFVHEKKLTEKTGIAVETQAGLLYPELHEDGLVTVDMGVPQLQPEEVPFLDATVGLRQPLMLDNGETIEVVVLSMGNPHAVQLVDDISTAPVLGQGPLIESHVRFPQRVNAGFMQIVNKRRIRLRVFERGSGETLACGSGACAAVVAGIELGKLYSPVTVNMLGGALDISWAGPGSPVKMTGPATTVFEGDIAL